MRRETLSPIVMERVIKMMSKTQESLIKVLLIGQVIARLRVTQIRNRDPEISQTEYKIKGKAALQSEKQTVHRSSLTKTK